MWYNFCAEVNDHFAVGQIKEGWQRRTKRKDTIVEFPKMVWDGEWSHTGISAKPIQK